MSSFFSRGLISSVELFVRLEFFSVMEEMASYLRERRCFVSLVLIGDCTGAIATTGILSTGAASAPTGPAAVAQFSFSAPSRSASSISASPITSPFIAAAKTEITSGKGGASVSTTSEQVCFGLLALQRCILAGVKDKRITGVR